MPYKDAIDWLEDKKYVLTSNGKYTVNQIISLISEPFFDGAGQELTNRDLLKSNNHRNLGRKFLEDHQFKFKFLLL